MGGLFHIAFEEVELPEVPSSAMFDVVGEESFGVVDFVAVVLGAVPFIDGTQGFLALLFEKVAHVHVGIPSRFHSSPRTGGDLCLIPSFVIIGIMVRKTLVDGGGVAGS